MKLTTLLAQGYLAMFESIRLCLARHVFSLLQGVTFGDWWYLLRKQGFAIDIRYWPRAAQLTIGSFANSAFGWWEDRRFGRQIEAAAIQPPVFILGHYRSGTTHLHNLLSLDKQFGYPTLRETVYPHTFLTVGKMIGPLMSMLMTRQRPQDNMSMSIRLPAEDELGLCTATSLSPYLGWVFPRGSVDYQKYLTLRDIPDQELARWKAALVHFLKKLTLAVDRPLLLKSPPHTARIRHLLELFPKARFVHIHRHPYAVFASTMHLWKAGPPTWQLQCPGEQDVAGRIIRTYNVMYDAYFEDRTLIPPGQFCEVGYENLESNPRQVVQSIYNALQIPSFASVGPVLDDHLRTIQSYRKNSYPCLPEPLRQRIFREWQRSFTEWGYLPGVL
jgi:hypothetical protein